MKKFLIAMGIVSATVIPSFAEGYQVNTLSARQNGMGHTGVAQKLGAESMIFNPAGMAFMKSTLEFEGSVTGIFATAKATLPDHSTYHTSNPVSTPMSFNLGMSVFDKFKVGLSFYTPYGSGIKWGENWPGAVLNQSVSLKTFTLQPTLSWRINHKVAVGAGVMVTWGNVNLDKGLVSAASFDAMLGSLGASWPISDVPASINLNGKADVAVGFNVGAMWDVSNKVTVGASFRSKMNMKVKRGTASLSYANDAAHNILQSKLDVLDKTEFAAEMPCPYVLNVGASYRPVQRLELAFDAQLTGWHSYRYLDINFLSDHLSAYNQHLVKNYRDSWTFKLGSKYSLTDRLDLRLGLMIDTTPVRKDHYNPETPGMTKISPALGFSFSPLKDLSIDAALQYVAGLGADKASVTYKDLLFNVDRTFVADYKVHAWNPSVGLSLHF